MKTGSRIRLRTAPVIMQPMLYRGWPSARMMAVKPGRSAGRAGPRQGSGVGCSLRPGSVRSAEEQGNLGGEAQLTDGRTETAGGNQGGGVADGVIRLLLLAAAEAPG